jgi:hypothetical protein
MNKPKPCPFCGGEAKFLINKLVAKRKQAGWRFGIYCTKCGVVFPKTDYRVEMTFSDDGEIKPTIDEREIAAEAWNRRVNDE